MQKNKSHRYASLEFSKIVHIINAEFTTSSHTEIKSLCNRLTYTTRQSVIIHQKFPFDMSLCKKCTVVAQRQFSLENQSEYFISVKYRIEDSNTFETFIEIVDRNLFKSRYARYAAVKKTPIIDSDNAAFFGIKLYMSRQ